jgi:hypothetical protein
VPSSSKKSGGPLCQKTNEVKADTEEEQKQVDEKVK